MAVLNLEIVAVERELWTGEATFLFTRTTAGEIGILPNHIPLVAQLVDDAMVRVEREGEDRLEHVHEEDAALAEAPGAGVFHEVERHRLLHAGTGQADDEGDLRHGVLKVGVVLGFRKHLIGHVLQRLFVAGDHAQIEKDRGLEQRLG